MTVGPWIWNARVDLGVFAGAAAVALGLVALGPWLADEGGALPAWGFLAFVVAIDVAHVWSTLFRTYFDREELSRRPLLYGGVPAGCFAAGVALHTVSSAWFWRALAYVALFHFMRQQAGWVAIYRARAGRSKSRFDRVVDDAAIYAATGVPVVYWHANLPRAFHWFVPGDFASVAALRGALPLFFALWAVAIAVYAARAIQLALRERRVEIGKHAVVAGTVATWWVGIVATNTDYAFSVANVVVHGVPYFALLWFYAKERSGERPASVASRIVVRGGFAAFMTVLLGLAFAEEMVWDRLVWRSRPDLFGGAEGPEPSAAALAVIVPLLAVPQATHYVLDAVLWRRRDTGRAQARAMGFATAP